MYIYIYEKRNYRKVEVTKLTSKIIEVGFPDVIRGLNRRTEVLEGEGWITVKRFCFKTIL